MTRRASVYKEILWFARHVDGKPVQIVAEYHQHDIIGYGCARQQTGRVQAGRFQLRVKKGEGRNP